MHPLIRKLSVFRIFSSEEESAVALACAKTFTVERGEEFAREDDVPTEMFVLLEGMACRYKFLANGKRQILSFMLPGDTCDLRVTLLDRRDHSIRALSTCVVASLSDDAIRHLTGQYPNLAEAWNWATLAEESLAREWIANVGQRSSTERLAHLICELHFRMKAMGLVDAGNGFDLPLTQPDLADALAISAVHVNRVLHDLRERKLLAFGGRRMTVLNVEALQDVGGFDPLYLHVPERPRVSLVK